MKVFDRELTTDEIIRFVRDFAAQTRRHKDCRDCLYIDMTLALADEVEKLSRRAAPENKPNNAGLHIKYDVRKVSDGSIVNNCFVLRPDRDPSAITALRAYADATENKALAEDIYKWVGRAPENKVLTVEQFERECDLRRDTGKERWLWCEDKTDAESSGYYRVSRLSQLANITTYGKTWLAYASRPENAP